MGCLHSSLLAVPPIPFFGPVTEGYFLHRKITKRNTKEISENSKSAGNQHESSLYNFRLCEE